eukprot:gene6063-8348_t
MKGEEIFRRLFSPFSMDSDANVVAYAVYEFSLKVTNYSFGYFMPLLIVDLGTTEFGSSRGSALWSQVVVAYSVTTVVSYIAFTPIIEFGSLRRWTLLICSTLAAIMHILFIFCYTGGAVYLAIILVICSKTLVRIGDVAYEGLLDGISKEKDPHQISSRSNFTGYIGMLLFLVVAGPILAILYFVVKLNSLWVTYLLPMAFIGIWYLLFIQFTKYFLSPTIGIGPTLPESLDGNIFQLLYGGLKIGLSEQLGNFRFILPMRDLGLFILSFIFLSGAANTAVSVAAVLGVSVLHLSIIYLGAAFLLGIISALAGVIFYKYLLKIEILLPKQVILINMVVLLLCSLFVITVHTGTQIIILAVVAGFQVGSITAFSRSILTTLMPENRQARLFSLYELSQDATGWIGSAIISSLIIVYGKDYFRNIVAIVCAIQFGIGLPILFCVNIERGITLRKLFDEVQKDSFISVNTERTPTIENDIKYNNNLVVFEKENSLNQSDLIEDTIEPIEQ